MSTSSAWPFLVGRSRNAGHRVVVAPDYLADSGDTAKLGLLSRGETGPGEAYFTQVPFGPDGQPALAVYRVFRARRSDYLGYSGADDEPLTDREGRDIRITEGFLVCPAPADPEDLGLTTTDIEAAHRLLERPYQLFWQTEDDYALQPSHRITVGAPGQGSPLVLRPPGSRPPVIKVPAPLPTRSAPSSQEPAEEPPYGRDERDQKFVYDQPPNDRTGRLTQEDRPLRWRVIATAVAALITFGAVLGIYSVITRVDTKPTAPATSTPASGKASTSAASTNATQGLSATLAEICADLDAGNVHAAYALTTSAFHSKTSEAAFKDELTEGTGKVKYCATATASGTKTASTTMAITTTGGVPREWTVELIRRGAAWKVSDLNPDQATPGPSRTNPTTPAPSRTNPTTSAPSKAADV